MAIFLTLFGFADTDFQCPPQLIYAGYSHQELFDAHKAASLAGGFDHFLKNNSTGSELLGVLPTTAAEREAIAAKYTDITPASPPAVEDAFEEDAEENKEDPPVLTLPNSGGPAKKKETKA